MILRFGEKTFRSMKACNAINDNVQGGPSASGKRYVDSKFEVALAVNLSCDLGQ